MKEKVISRFYIIFILTAILIGSIKAVSYTAKKIIHYPEILNSIEKAWQWVENQVKDYKEGYWIGYSFERLMSENSFIRYSCDYDSNKPSLGTILYNDMKYQKEKNREPSVQEAAKMALKKKNEQDKKVMKEIAILFNFNSGKPEIKKVNKIAISNLSQHFDLENKPVFWLGKCEKKESVSFLNKSYELTTDEDCKKEIITCISLHQYNPFIINFLTKVIKHENNTELRKNAIFWLSQQETDEVLPQIINVIKNDPLKDVREHAVFALSLIKSEKALNMLIELARDSKKFHVQKQAIFWLSQKACERSAEILNEIVYDCELTEIQKQAVFALSQLKDSEAISNLITISKNHPNIEVRKAAIFWLGQSKDDKALEALISIVQKQ